MAFRLLMQPLKRTTLSVVSRDSHSVASVTPKIGPDGVPTEHHIYATEIGTRDIVGFGWNGLPSYYDRSDFPFPAIRWREETPEINLLRQKEKGDWKKLTKHEKKALYRHSFCQTFAEFEAPTGEWKLCVAGGLIAASLAIWFAIWMRLNILPPLPESVSEASRKAQLKRMLDLGVGHVDGLSSKWDYENKKWK